MDKLTRYFIATSPRLSYLIHDEERTAQTGAETSQPYESQFNSVSFEAPMNKNKTNSSKQETPTDSDYDLEKFVKRFQRKLAKPKFVLEFAGFLVLSVYAGFTIAMYCATRDAANAATGALTHAKGTSVYDLRPYVNVTKLDFSVVKDSEKLTAKGTGFLTNTGKTPAVSVYGCTDVVMLPNTEPMTDDFPCPAPQNPKRIGGEISSFSLGSGAPFPIESPGTTLRPTSATVDQVYPLFVRGDFRVYFYGDVGYGDILKSNNTYRTLFCGRYNFQTGKVDICEKHNGMN